MAIEFAKIAERRGIGWIHPSGLAIEALGFFVFLAHFRVEATLHDGFDPGALCGVHDVGIEKVHCSVHAEFFQFFRGVLGLAREEALFIEHRTVERNGAILVAGLGLFLRSFELLLDGFFALFHFRFDQLFDLIDFEKAFCIFQLADDRAVRLGEDDNWEFFATQELLAQRGAGISDAHGDALGSVERETARIAKAGALKFLAGRGEPINDESACRQRIVRFDQLPWDLVYLLVARAARTAARASHAARPATATTAASGPVWSGQQQQNHEKRGQSRKQDSHYVLLSLRSQNESSDPRTRTSGILPGLDARLGFKRCMARSAAQDGSSII